MIGIVGLIPFLTILFSAQSFNVELIHRDSPKSPFYNPSVTKWDRINDAFSRSISRVGHFRKLTSKSSSEVKLRLLSADGEFIMGLSIGTPPISQFGIVDTGSDLTWFQCKPCEKCFHQKSPIFDPKDSSTYRNIPCNTSSCKIVHSYACDQDIRSYCRFGLSYGDQSFASGYVASETITFKSTSRQEISVSKVVLGCGHNNYGTFENRSDGVIGLGGGSESFINQAINFTSRKFSYCLPPLDSRSNATGKISFGHGATLIGPSLVTTPLKNPKKDGFYYITIKSIWVNKKKIVIINMEEQKHMENNDIILDSGTTLTLLPNHLYDPLSLEIVKSIPQKAILDPSGRLPLCYNSKDKIKYPKITFMFEGGAEVELQGTSTFIQIDDDRVCLTIVPSGPVNLALFGNLAQSNHFVGFDLVNNLVSFKPSDCAK